jgi:hypothetical protein
MASRGVEEKIDIGRVLQRAFQSIGHNAVAYVLLAFVLVGLPNFGLYYLAMSAVTLLPNGRFALTEGIDVLTTVGVGLGLLLLVTFTGNLMNAAVVRSVILDLSGRPADLKGSMVTALSLALPMLGLTIVMGLGLIVGFLLLVVPFVIFFLMWIVAVPVLVEERRGVLGSMARSAELTRGTRWRILGVYLVVGFITAAVSNIGARIAMLASDPFWLVLANAVTAALGGVLGAALVASLYVELRTVKEGATADTLADVFA